MLSMTVLQTVKPGPGVLGYADTIVALLHLRDLLVIMLEELQQAIKNR
jgi:hypothetical protein